ncbi:MAG: Spy/CpxP family protein refolding chaperone [bacterium]
MNQPTAPDHTTSKRQDRMRRPVTHAVVIAMTALVGITSLSQAQYGGSRSSQRNNNQEDIGTRGAPPIPPGIAALALERSAELGLTDVQNAALAVIRTSQDSANKPRLKTLDSLRPTRRPANGINDLSQEQRDEIEARRVAIAPVLEAVRETNAEARIKVMALLNENQQKRAAELERDAQKQAEEEYNRRSRDAFGGNDGMQRRRGGGGGGRPPEG